MTTPESSDNAPPAADHDNGSVTRRAAIKGGFATLGAAAFAVSLAPLREAADGMSAEEFFQQHYKELSDDDKQDVIQRLEDEALEQYGAEVTIADDRPIRMAMWGSTFNPPRLNQAARHVDRSTQLLETGQQGAAHPVHPGMPETSYLKTFFVRVLPRF